MKKLPSWFLVSASPPLQIYCVWYSFIYLPRKYCWMSFDEGHVFWRRMILLIPFKIDYSTLYYNNSKISQTIRLKREFSLILHTYQQQPFFLSPLLFIFSFFRTTFSVTDTAGLTLTDNLVSVSSGFYLCSCSSSLMGYYRFSMGFSPRFVAFDSF